MNNPKPEILYHGSTHRIERFTPTSGIDLGGRPYNDETLATSHKQQSMLYACKLKEIDKAGMPKDADRGIDPADYMFTNQIIRTPRNPGGTAAAILRNRDKYLSEFKGGYLHKLDSTPFHNKLTADNLPSFEWGASGGLKPDSVEQVSLEDAMRAGAQVFFMREGLEKNERQFFEENGPNLDCGDKHIAWLKRMVDEGLLIHENAVRGINPMDLSPPPANPPPLGDWTANPRNGPGRRPDRPLQ